MASPTEAPAHSGGPLHRAPSAHPFRNMFWMWLPLALAADLVYWFAIGPHMPPGDATSSANGQQFDFNVLAVTAIPIVLAIWVYMGYALVNWRASRMDSEVPAGIPARTALRVQTSWITLTTLIVLGLFIFGTYELIAPAGAGGGEGPQAIWTPTTKTILPIQVIGQQWMWTYRYPTFGGFETDQLIIPENTEIAFHVTSLDVIHDFWAYELGIKADANPDVDNIAYTETGVTPGVFVVRCDELCGLWHGAMYNYGRIETKAAFYHWAKSTEKKLADNTKNLPPFAWTYTPDANGADGGYYPDNVDPYNKYEVYGSHSVKIAQYGATPKKSK